MVINESNSTSCGGQAGVSDTYATSLWSLDYLLEAARGGVSRVGFHTSTAAICGDLKARESDEYPVSYRYYGASARRTRPRSTAAGCRRRRCTTGCGPFRQVPDGRFVDLGVTDADLPRLRAYGVESGHGTLTIVLINVQDPASASSTKDAVTPALPGPTIAGARCC